MDQVPIGLKEEIENWRAASGSSTQTTHVKTPSLLHGGNAERRTGKALENRRSKREC